MISERKEQTKAFRLYWSGLEEPVEFDKVEEVHEFVKMHPDRGYTVYLGPGVGRSSAEVQELMEKWRLKVESGE